MNRTKPWALGLMVICALFTSSAQILYKMGANKLSFNIISIITNWQLILGITFYGLGAILVIIALRGGEVTVLYPIITSSYIWVAIASIYFFKEIVNLSRWIGIFLIILGILMIIFGAKDKEVIKFIEPG